MNIVRYVFLIVLFFTFGCSQNESPAKGSAENKHTATAQDNPRSTKDFEAGEEGVTTSGYRFRFHISNNGRQPRVGDQVQYHEIVFKNDSLVTSTYYHLNPTLAIIPPLTEVPNPPPPNYEAILLMSAGDSLSVWHDLDTIPITKLPKWLRNDDELVYHIKLLSVKPKAEIEKALQATKAREQSVGDSLRAFVSEFKAGKLKDIVTTTESGLSYIIHESGVGDSIKAGRFLQVHYMGILQDNGVSFNNTFGPAKPFAFQVGRGRVIKGWDEALLKLKKGGKMTIFIPYALGYGEAGRPGKKGEPAYIPEKADLAFYVEVLDVR